MASVSDHIPFIVLALSALAGSLADESVEIGCTTTSVNGMIDSIIVESKNSNLKQSIKNSMLQLSKASRDFDSNGVLGKVVTTTLRNNSLTLSALESCRELLSIAMTNLNKSFCSADGFGSSLEARDDLNSWLCAAGTNLQTCLYGFEDLSSRNVMSLVYNKLKSAIAATSYSRAMVARKVKGSNPNVEKKEPFWLRDQEKRLVEVSKANANVVVAKDGSGKYTSISDAVKAIPSNGNKTFVIYVKKGVYYEYVRVQDYHWNVMIIGDGMYETSVSGSLSQGGGKITFDTATFVFGQGFIARDMGFVNTAGPSMGQAVALLSSSDRSVFYQCRFEGYQDTLFVLSNRQFYRECHIYGTIDFIFGAASAVLQRSNIRLKKPLHGQQNAIMAHFKRDSQCQTGIVVQKCVIEASEDLAGAPTYLGRPWTDFSTMVFMQNNMNTLIDPKGWLPWTEVKDPPASTVFLAEYDNVGTGASVANRVKWKGVRTNLSHGEADKFTVRSLINGDRWIPATSVSFDPGL